MSQLLREQVVGRGLRRASYDLDADGPLSEEVATVLGVPFENVPFKQNPTGRKTDPPKTWHILAMPDKAEFEIRLPRVEGYVHAIRARIAVDWDRIANLQGCQ